MISIDEGYTTISGKFETLMAEYLVITRAFVDVMAKTLPEDKKEAAGYILFSTIGDMLRDMYDGNDVFMENAVRIDKSDFENLIKRATEEGGNND